MTGFARLSCLTAPQTLFLWMFLAADPLEQLASTGALPALETDSYDAAMQFAAAWRHGMAGNSVLYMPGFFLTAATMWVHTARNSVASALLQGAATASIAVLLAALLSSWGAQQVVQTFAAQHNVRAPELLPAASPKAAAVGCYTLMTWSVFVVCARSSLIRRTARPLLIPAAFTVVLVLVRPWTADDFSRFWAQQVLAGTPAAWLSLLSVPALSAALVSWELILVGQRSQSHAPTE
jgi:hypothetical protein